MVSQNQPTNNSNVRYVFAQTGMSFLWKLLIVLAGVGAYYGLNSMENTKATYDKARDAAIVIVDKAADTKTERNSVEMEAAGVKAFYDQADVRKAMAEQAKQLSPPVSADEFIVEMKGYIDRVKYQPFRNGDEVLESLNQEILKDQAAAEKSSQQQIDIIDKQAAAQQARFVTQQLEKCPPLKEKEQPAKAKEIPATKANHAGSPKPTPPPTAESICEGLKKQIESTEENRRFQNQLEQNKLAAISNRKEARVRSVYQYLRPKLLAQVEIKKNESPLSSFAFFFPANVLDDRNGIHVIYSIFWLTCMVILIFGVLFLILLVLRPLPPFAGGAEALSEQARTFLSKRSATPELAKTLIAATAAVGIGTAVAVAGGTHNLTPGRSADLGTPAQYQQGSTDGKPGDGSRRPQPQASPVINVTAYAPVAYPSPMTINIPSSEGRAIAALGERVGGFDGRLETIRLAQEGMPKTVQDMINGTIEHNVRPSVDQLDRTTNELRNDQEVTGANLLLAQAGLDDLQQRADTLEVDFFKRADEFNNTLQDFRNEQLRQPQRMRTQNIFTRAKQLFTPGPERYLVTEQSYQLLKSIMCASDNSSPSSSSSNPLPSPPCSLTLGCKCSSEVSEIFTKLKKMIGKEPKPEGAFMSQFDDDANDPTTNLGPKAKEKLKLWKSLILKYSRVV